MAKKEKTKYELIKEVAGKVHPQMFQFLKANGFFSREILIDLLEFWKLLDEEQCKMKAYIARRG